MSSIPSIRDNIYFSSMVGESAITFQARRLFTPEMREWDKLRIIDAVRQIPLPDLEDIVTQALLVLTPQMNSIDRRTIISTVEAIPSQNRAAIIAQAFRLMTPEMESWNREVIINAVREIPLPDLEDVVTQVLLVVTPQMNSIDRRTIISTVEATPSQNRAAIITQALRLMTPEMQSWNRAAIIDAVREIPLPDLEDIVTQALLVLTPQMGVMEKSTIINTVRAIPSQNRAAIITQALRLMTPEMRGWNREEIINAVREIPLQHLEDVVTQALRLVIPGMTSGDIENIIAAMREIPLQHLEDVVTRALQQVMPQMSSFDISELIFRSSRHHPVVNMNQIEHQNDQPQGLTFMVDMNQLFDEQGNPTTPHIPLRELYSLVGEDLQFPRIQYLGAPEAIDLGGVSRDFITTQMKALCHPQQTGWRMVRSNEGCLPQLLPNHNLNENQQIMSIKGIGIIFSQAFNNPRMAIGNYFHPILYDMIYSLTEEEVDAVNDQATIDPTSLVFKKLVKMYLKRMYPRIFSSEEELNSFVDNGTMSQNLNHNGVDENFLSDYVMPCVRPALLIAQTIKHRNPNTRWDTIKGQSSQAFRTRIEGTFSKDQVIQAFDQEALQSPQGNFLRRWIDEHSEEEVKRFLFALSGAETLSPNQRLYIEIRNHQTDQHAVGMHTCTFTMDMPPYTTYEAFTRGLQLSIDQAYTTGQQRFQFA